MMRALALLCAVPTGAAADFVQNNLLAIFYHELGHAIIDQMDVPIFGQEEDAADALSILLIDQLFEEAAAEQIAYDSAALFWAEADDAPAFWDTHGPSEQRYYNTVCLFYGANPDAREAFAQELELPPERADTCADEFDLAYGSWTLVLDEMAQQDWPGKLIYTSAAKAPGIAEEIEALNREFGWPQDIEVHSAPCGEANAFYDLQTGAITLCTELTGWLQDIEARL